MNTTSASQAANNKPLQRSDGDSSDALEKSDSKGAETYSAKQQSFKDDYIRSWVPEFCEKIRQGTDNKFYKDLADCASDFVN